MLSHDDSLGLADVSGQLQHFNDVAVTEYLIHLLETFPLSFWVEKGVANSGDEVECEEEVEEGEADVLQSNWSTLRKDQV